MRLTLDDMSAKSVCISPALPTLPTSGICTHAAALGNFFVNLLNASAGMTAKVVSTVALAIVPSLFSSRAKLCSLDLPLSCTRGSCSPSNPPGVPGAEVMGSRGREEVCVVVEGESVVPVDSLAMRAVPVEDVKDPALGGRTMGGPGEREVRVGMGRRGVEGGWAGE